MAAACALSVGALSACAVQPTIPPGPPQLGLQPVAAESLQGWRQAPASQLLPAFLQQCHRLASLPADTPLGGAGLARKAGGQAGDWTPFCRAIRWVPAADDAAARKTIVAWLQPYAVLDRGSPVAHFTGYFEPEVAGALTRDAAAPVPVYRRPPDLRTAQPAVTREQIDHGALQGRALAICWLASPIDLFFLQVQGSGRVRLPSGQIIRLGYAGRNSAPYVPIGRVLVQRGELARDAVTMQSIRAWLEAHPEQAQAVMEQNPNYVFFRVLDDLRPDQGPIGALGVPLEPMGSVAVDPRFLPLAAPVWVDTVVPAMGEGQAQEQAQEQGSALHRLMLAQDSGAGIDGPTRADIFFGWGTDAARLAGKMDAAGRLVVWLPRPPP